MRLLVDGGLPFAHGIVGLGGEIAWPRPTRAGDTLHVGSEIVEIRHSRSKPQQGILTVRSTMLNQGGEAVYLLTAKLLVFTAINVITTTLALWGEHSGGSSKAGLAGVHQSDKLITNPVEDLS
jgi:hypothetical protein